MFPTFNAQDYQPKTADWTAIYDDVVRKTDNSSRRLRTYWYVIQQFDAYPRLLAAGRIQPGVDQWATTNAICLRDYTIPPAEPARTRTLTEIHEALSDNLNKIRGRFDGWTTLQNGIARKHRAIEFRRSGAISYNLTNKRFGQEKTVDVNLAVDMITFADMYDIAVTIWGSRLCACCPGS